MCLWDYIVYVLFEGTIYRVHKLYTKNLNEIVDGKSNAIYSIVNRK